MKLSQLINYFTQHSYFRSFAIIALCFILAFSTLSLAFLNELKEKSHFIEREIQGCHFIQALSRTLEISQDHKRQSTNFFSGNQLAKEEVHKLELSMEEYLTQLEDLSSLSNSVLFYNEEHVPIRDELKVDFLRLKWNELSHNLPNSCQQLSDEEHRYFIDKLLGFIDYIGDVSGLILDPEIPSYYLASINIIHQPHVLDTIERLTSKSQNIALSKTISFQDRLECAGYCQMINQDLDNAQSALQKAFVAERRRYGDLKLRESIEGTFRQCYQNTKKFLDWTQYHVISAKDAEIVSLQEQESITTDTLKAGYQLWQSSISQLEKILQARLNQTYVEERNGVIYAILWIIAVILLCFFMERRLSIPLQYLYKAAKQITAGDLTCRVPVAKNDLIGQVSVSFNQMTDSLQRLINKLQREGVQLSSSITELAASSKEQEATVIEQETTTKQIAVSAQEISATAKEFAKSMTQFSATMDQTSQLASTGKASLAQMEMSMRQMVDASSNIAAKLSVLNEKANNITVVVTTITKVADQTNLLSLNAAIEAEKAGEFGRSFSVIAQEIRRLADQTAVATLDIEKMVSEVVSAVSASVMGVDKFSEDIRVGVNEVGKVGEQLATIISGVQAVNSNFETLSKGINDQATGAEQINQSINELSEAAQHTTESIRQFQRTIEQLTISAQELRDAVFQVSDLEQNAEGK